MLNLGQGSFPKTWREKAPGEGEEMQLGRVQAGQRSHEHHLGKGDAGSVCGIVCNSVY